MAVQAIAFYLLATVTLVAGVCVVSARSPVHSVLFLILAFFSAAGLFVMLGAEFLAMLLVVVYVGAVAVLFLFVVMMLDVDFASLRQGFARYMPLGAGVAGILAFEMIMVSTAVANGGAARLNDTPQASGADISNAETIGRVLYTDYIYFFQAAGLVLLVAMIGAIVLTLRHKPGVRRQVIADQVARGPKTGMRVISIKPGAGIDE
ncbi:NADH-quinone oxidoreductase subunit J [Phenylobacterium sp.]|jgi:NADH-quinone oxidoreductase subunit J|uniref:NADH-quinone oxidoreductase subunit J n=1 Tax=Phenylobacterium sp. TaxID=1871053 RepID=UPI001B5B22AF|nr:NADH-quinone oxidoreductase subunit J [Phenylobacterium sp.]MBP6546624.1 NADH-quinone oxidoreductase subunit J [Phenylobacterium sp.]MBP7815182.1 NADH-quinone oxidoreductase subunit J [Phenylobacterium sp.]MBP9756594.1 NADH-quinone oxidoreductase subunit J [Phenylobacterium sp.]MDO8802197.1 NADH-quinone oxidoreductase subunit J [Phenylobacterium sp.]